MTIQSIPNSDANTTRSSNEGQTTPNPELSKEEFFENNLIQFFTKSLLAVSKTKNALLREDRYCITNTWADQLQMRKINFLVCNDRFSKYPKVQ